MFKILLKPEPLVGRTIFPVRCYEKNFFQPEGWTNRRQITYSFNVWARKKKKQDIENLVNFGGRVLGC